MDDLTPEEIIRRLEYHRRHDPNWRDVINKRIYDHVIWSDQCKFLNGSKPKKEISFDECFDLKIRKSMLGLFLDSDEEPASRDIREAILGVLEYDTKSFSSSQWELWERRNDFTEENLRDLVTDAILRNVKIDRGFLEQKLVSLRLLGAQMTKVDKSLRKFRHLQVLSLTLNWIEDLKGNVLPRGLKMLQLANNRIWTLKNLIEGAPKGLIYLGMSNNQLRDDEELHLLARAFNELKVLDLEGNDLSNLADMTEALKSMATLRALVLEGNPCSVLPNYKNVVQCALPRLIYLDNVKLKSEDTNKKSCFFDDEEIPAPALFMYVYRIMNLEKPPKQKNVNFIYFFEVELPLLDPDLSSREEIEEILEESAKELRSEKSTLGKEDKNEVNENEEQRDEKVENSKSRKVDSTKKEPQEKRQKEKLSSIYSFEDVYQEELKNPPRVTSFKSKEFEYNDFIYSNEPLLEVLPINGDLKLLRDTFQSVITVRLVCQKVIRDEKQKKAKAKQSDSEIEEEIKRRKIQAKIILCKFTCSLKNVSWADRSLDFSWSCDQPENQPATTCDPGSLALLNYVVEKSTSKSIKSTTQKSRDEIDVKDSLPLPKLFTVQVGFGVRRHPEFQPLSISNPVSQKRKK